MMSGIRGTNTRPEMVVRRGLHAAGYRYRLHVAKLPGKPDIVLPRYRVSIFVNGCFWHRHKRCHYTTTPATRNEFWQQKFKGNRLRDQRNTEALVSMGWKVVVLWECGLKHQPEETFDQLLDLLESGEDSRQVVEIPVSPPRLREPPTTD
jgi:DNA mismatch endonuclease (patch repair protein)